MSTPGILECSNTGLPVTLGSCGTCLENRKTVNKWWSSKVAFSIHCHSTEDLTERAGKQKLVQGTCLCSQSPWLLLNVGWGELRSSCLRDPWELFCPPHTPFPIASFWLLLISTRPGVPQQGTFLFERLQSERTDPGPCGHSEGVSSSLVRCWRSGFRCHSAWSPPFFSCKQVPEETPGPRLVMGKDSPHCQGSSEGGI